jgi:hypothetical protein
MRDQQITLAGRGRLVVRATPSSSLEIKLGNDSLTTQLAEGELLMVIEALAMAYAEVCGARPDSIARGVKRTIANRTRVARERRQQSTRDPA